MNSPRLRTLVSDASSAGLYWADWWLPGPHTREVRESQAGPAVGFQPKDNRKIRKGFLFFKPFQNLQPVRIQTRFKF
jgi:hypothetical protein